MTTSRDFNLSLLQVVVGTFRVTGLISAAITKASDDFSVSLSVDGAHVSRNRIANNLHELAITVRHGSGGALLLANAYQEQLQESDRGALTDMPASVYDPVSKRSISESAALFKKGPESSYGQDAPDLTFVLILPNPTVDNGD